LGASTRITFRVSPESARELAGAYDTTPTQHVIGEEPIRSPVSDVVGHLGHKGHHHPVVARFVSDYLRPLEALIRKVGTWQYPFEFGCVLLTAAHLIEGQRLVNEVLAEANRSGRGDGFIPPYALFILGGAADDGITHVFSNHFRRRFLSGPDFLGLTPSANAFGRPTFLADEAAVAALLHKKLARRRVWDDVFRSRMTTPGPSFLKMLKSLRAVMAILSREPVMVDTGQYRPRLQQRTFADQLGEIQNQLTNLKNYQAKAKTLSGEYTIKTLPPPKGVSGPALQERLARIKRQMRFLGITRPVVEVLAEVRKRHDRLRGNG
jgi:hypothetical protein